MKPASFIALLMVLITVSVAADEMVIPEGIRYKATTDEANQRAKDRLTRFFTAQAKKQDVLSLFETRLICGPALWMELKKDETLSKLKEGVITFHLPVVSQGKPAFQKMDGKLFQTPDELWAFWKVFVKRTDFSDLKIRKLNPMELRIYWAMISFDITEPIFILESGKHKILAAFVSPDNPKIFWIDDYQSVGFKKE